VCLENLIEDTERRLKNLIDKIEAVDDLANRITEAIQMIHELGSPGEAERLRQILSIWHVFGQMSPEGPII